MIGVEIFFSKDCYFSINNNKNYLMKFFLKSIRTFLFKKQKTPKNRLPASICATHRCTPIFLSFLLSNKSSFTALDSKFIT